MSDKKAFASMSWSGSVIMVDKDGYGYPKSIEYIVFPNYYYDNNGWPRDKETGVKCKIWKT